MNRRRFYKPVLGMAGCIFLVLVGFSQRHLNVERGQMGLTRIQPLENAPPLLAFTTVALGGFRGLIANALWIRATDLQENDKYFEMVTLADWITKLQPHFTTVWVHQAWNMAYNISIKFTDEKVRWQWVRRGIELLRDEGLKYNPTEPLIYRELAWFFQHKMGANLDDAHNYYKEVWAEQMEPFFPNGRPNLEALLHPKTAEEKERVRKLREVYKMDPAVIQQVDERYGPLEWRLPETHAIYWAFLGLQHTRGIASKKGELIQLRRVIFQSMQLAFQRGKLFFPTKNSKEFVYGPNLDILEKTNQAYEEMMRDDEEMRANIATGHKNFLKTAVYFLYTHSRLSEAEKWFEILKKRYPTAVLNDNELAAYQKNPKQPLPNKSLDDYAMEMIGTDVGETSHDRVTAIVMGMLKTSMMYQALSQDDRALGYFLLAQKVYDRFQSAIGKQSTNRVGLDPFPALREDALRQVLDPESGLDAELGLRLKSALGLPADWGKTTNSVRGVSPPAPGQGTNGPPSAVSGKSK